MMTRKVQYSRDAKSGTAPPEVPPLPPCPRPFEWCEIHRDGSVFPCCPSWLKRPLGRLGEEPIARIWNSPTAVEIRKSILNASYHNCNRSRCPRLRGGSTQAVEPGAAPALEAIALNRSTLDYAPPRLNLCFDPSCNLACPSCRTRPRIADPGDRRRAERISASVQRELLPGAEQLSLSGEGDPFASPVYFALLRNISSRTCPRLREIRLHSNGLLFDREHWRQLPGIHQLVGAIEISVDAASAATYALNRGGDFARLLRNLDFIATLGASLRLSMVVQSNNVDEIETLYALARNLGAHLYLSRLVNWGTFSSEEFARRDIANPRHPQHARLREVLAGLHGREGVDAGNLAQPSS